MHSQLPFCLLRTCSWLSSPLWSVPVRRRVSSSRFWGRRHRRQVGNMAHFGRRVEGGPQVEVQLCCPPRPPSGRIHCKFGHLTWIRIPQHPSTEIYNRRQPSQGAQWRKPLCSCSREIRCSVDILWHNASHRELHRHGGRSISSKIHWQSLSIARVLSGRWQPRPSAHQLWPGTQREETWRW